MNKLILFFLFIVSSFANAQQLNCTVTVNAQKTSNPNQQVYKTLQNSLTEFINKTDWNGQSLKQNEKINCSFFITINSGESGDYSATLQIQTSRPIFDSTYTTPIFNYNDKDFNFKYTEFENLIYNPTSFDSNLVSVISFYCNLIIGFDADSFVDQGGTPFFEVAQNIANVAQQSGYKGWNQADGTQNRYYMISDLMSPTYSEIRTASYLYNTALDGMSKDLKGNKEKIVKTISSLNKVHSARPNSLLMRAFFDAKADEIVSIFSNGSSVSITEIVDDLNKFSPMNSSKWSSIKY